MPCKTVPYAAKNSSFSILVFTIAVLNFCRQGRSITGLVQRMKGARPENVNFSIHIGAVSPFNSNLLIVSLPSMEEITKRLQS
jgi:hypothetical protein